MNIRRILGVTTVVVSCAAGASSSAMAHRLPEPGVPGQPLASGQVLAENVHGAIHCQAAAKLFIDPTLTPGSAPGAIVITPNGPVLGGPRHGLCAELYTAFTGQQP